jgi:hypothetical protein
MLVNEPRRRLPKLEKRLEPAHDSNIASGLNREAEDTVAGNRTTPVLVAGERRNI